MCIRDRTWIAGITDTCYQIQNTTTAYLDVYGQLYPNITSPDNDSIVTRNQFIELNATVIDDCNADITDANVLWFNETWYQIASGYNTNWTVPSRYETGSEIIHVNSTRTFYDEGTSNVTINVFGLSEIEHITPSNGTEYLAGLDVTVTCKVRDADILTPIQNYPVNFYRNGYLNESGYTDEDGIATWIWTDTDIPGYYNITCNITDEFSLGYNYTEPHERYTIIRINRPLIIDQIYPETTPIYRNDLFTPNTTNITVHVKDAEVGDAFNATVSFYNSTTFLGECHTNSTGYCSIIYNPHDTITPGIHTIYANATIDNPLISNSTTETTTVTVKGILNITIDSPSNGSEFQRSDVVSLQSTLNDENGESVSATVKWYNSTGAEIGSGTDTFWTPLEQSPGWDEIMVQATRQYYDTGTDNTTILITATADVLWISPSNGTVIHYPTTMEPICLVRDKDSLQGVSNYPVNFSYNFTTTPEPIFNVTVLTNNTGHATYNFTTPEKGYMTILCNISDNDTLYYTVRYHIDSATFLIRDFDAPQILGTNITPTSQIEANLDYINITANITDNYRVYSVWAEIGFPNGSYYNVTMQNTTPEWTRFRGTFIPPIGGTYNVTVFAQDYPPESNLNSSFAGYFYVWGKSFGEVEQVDLVTLYGITQTDSDSFDMTVNFTNNGPAHMYDVNITMEEHSPYNVQFNQTFPYSCGDLAAGETCVMPVTVTVPAKTPPTAIDLYGNATWRNPDVSTNMTFGVTTIDVASNPVIDIHESLVTGVTPHGETTHVGSITVKSTGNDGLENIDLGTVGGNMEDNCPGCTVSLIPSTWGYLAAGDNFTVDISVSVPLGQSPGYYYTYISSVSSNDGSDIVKLNVSIPVNMTWNRAPETFNLVYTPKGTTGKVGDIIITNYGNVKIPFFVSRTGNGSDLILLDPGSLTVDKQASRNETVSYAIPQNKEDGIYYVQVVMRNVSADPPELITDFYLDVRPVEMTWNQTPSEINATNMQLRSGNFTPVNITNTGNIPMLIHLNVTGNISTRTGFNYTNITVPPGQTSTIVLNYTTPNVTGITVYTGYLFSYNSTSNVTHNSTLNITIYPFFVDIVQPSFDNPLNDVMPNSTVEVVVNVSDAFGPVSDPVEFTAYVLNETCQAWANVTSATYSSGLWYLDVTAPDLPTGHAYDFLIYANRTNIPYQDGSDRTNGSVIYGDIYPPEMVIDMYSTNDQSYPILDSQGSTIYFFVNVTENGTMQSMNAYITFPNGTTTPFPFTLLSKEDALHWYSLEFQHTENLGNYSVRIEACDLAGNCAEERKWFKIVEKVYYAGRYVDYESTEQPKLDGYIKFYEQGGNFLYYDVSIDSSGNYNESVHKDYFDIKYKVGQDYLDFYNVNINQTFYNPTIFGIIPASKIGAGGLKGLYIDSVLQFDVASLTFDYSDFVTEITASDLQIYKCTDWIQGVGCAVNWTNMSGSYHLVPYTNFIRVNLTNFNTHAYAIAEHICGDGICNGDENHGKCPHDCPAPPVTPPTPQNITGAAPGAGGGGGAGINITNISIPSVEQIAPAGIGISPTSMEATLEPGEYEIRAIAITNNKGYDIVVSLEVTGDVWDMVELERLGSTVPSKGSELYKVKLYALPTTPPGIYTGSIKLTIDGEPYSIPVTIRVVLPPQPLLDVKVAALNKKVEPGQYLRFRVDLSNLGQTKKVDVFINYVIKDVVTEDIIEKKEKTLALETSLSFTETMKIPEDTPPGKYVIEATAHYANRIATGVDSFDVVVPFWLFSLLWDLFTNIWIYLILFGLLPALYIAIKFYRRWRALKAARARYIFPVDIKKLPQPGPDAIEVGKIAETDMKAYFNINDLTTHGISAGATGSGKSVSAQVISEELLKRGIPVIVFDPTAQWSAFIRPCQDERMLSLYPEFGLRRGDARSFKTNVIQVDDKDMEIDIRDYMKEGEITVFLLNKLSTKDLDHFVRKTIEGIFKIPWPEAKRLKVFIVYDEVHRLLPKYGGSGGYVALERGAREFRKWGIGLWMISQVLSDYKGAIRANIATEIQLRTKYTGDLRRIKSKHGAEFAARVPRLQVGTGLVHNAEYNDGKPWFVRFRPLLHDVGRMSEEEINEYLTHKKNLDDLKRRTEALKERGVEVYDVETELEMAYDRLKMGQFRMVSSYVESLTKRIEELGG